MKRHSILVLHLAGMLLCADAAFAAGAAAREVWKPDGSAEISAGFGAADYSDGTALGGILAGKADVSLACEPERALRLRIAAFFEGESGPVQRYLRAGGRLDATLSPSRRFALRADLAGSASEGADPFRDSMRSRARLSAELDVVPSTLLFSVGYGAESDDFRSLGGYELRHRAWAEATLIPSVAPLAVLQASLFGETLVSTIESDRRSSPGAGLAADVEVLDGLSFSISVEYRYDLYESGVRAHAVLAGLRVRVKMGESAVFFVEYGLDANGSSSGTEAFLSQRVCAGVRVAS